MTAPQDPIHVTLDRVQDESSSWTVQTFGSPYLMHQKERLFRFMEESLETVQSGGLTEDEVLQVVRQVYDRPADAQIEKEIGGVLITLGTLAEAFGARLDRSFRAAMARCWRDQDAIRQRHFTKPARVEGIGNEP